MYHAMYTGIDIHTDKQDKEIMTKAGLNTADN